MKKIVITTMLALACFNPAWATTEDVSQVGEMVVTATREDSRAIDVPTHVEVISQMQIEQSGALNLGDLLGKFTTGHLHKYNGMLTSIGIRGFRTESHGDDLKGYVLLLVDGHRLGTGNAAKIDIARIEKIEIIKGPSSALYGSAAMGGVVNVITKKSTGDIKTTLTQEFGSFDWSETSIYSGGGINEKWGYDVSGSYSDVDDYDDPEFGTVYNTSEMQKKIGGNITFAPADNHMFRLGFDMADLTGTYPSWDNYTTYSNYVKDAVSKFDKSHKFFDLEYNGAYLDGKLKWKAMGYYLWDKNHWYTGYPDPDLAQSEYTDDTWGTDQQFTYALTPWNTLLMGFTLETLEKESKAVSNGAPSLPYTPGMEYDTQALFLQDSMDVMNNRLNVILAARYDNFDLTTKSPETGTLLSINERSENFDHISPKAGVSMKFMDEMLKVRTNVGVGFKAPSADQLSAMYEKSSSGSVSRYLGNPDLDPETSLTWDVGFDLFFHAADLSVTWFHTDYKDKIVTTSTEYDNKTWSTWENSGEAEFQGFDINLKCNLSQLFNWEPSVSLYSNLTVNTDFEDKDTHEDLLYISDYEIKSGMNINHRGWGMALSHVLVGPQMITNYDTYVDEEKGSFSFWDLNLKYDFMDNYGIEVNVLNLFDQTYEWVRGYIMPERTFNVALSYTF